jgi:hypothetical protein
MGKLVSPRVPQWNVYTPTDRGLRLLSEEQFATIQIYRSLPYRRGRGSMSTIERAALKSALVLKGLCCLWSAEVTRDRILLRVLFQA